MRHLKRLAPSSDLGRIFRKKPLNSLIAEAEGKHELARVLSTLDLTLMGVGKIVGGGIFVLLGVAAQTAGPALVVSFAIAGFAAMCSALCYAEFASRIPVAGGAYTYCYTSMGEIFGFLVAWMLILEYTCGAAAVARGWSGYTVAFLDAINVPISRSLLEVPITDWITVNPLAPLIIAVLCALLCLGVKESARVNGVVTSVKVLVLLLVIVAGFCYSDKSNWATFAPHGMEGVFSGASIIFYSYIGFDALSTTAEEAKNPRTTLPIAIVGSVVISATIYCLVAASITLMLPYQSIDLKAPLAKAFADRLPGMVVIVSTGAFIGLVAGILINLLSQPRIYLSLGRDGLLWPWLAEVHPRFQTPINATVLTSCASALLSALLDISVLAQLVSGGTIGAFTMVCMGVLMERKGNKEAPLQLPLLLVGIIITWLAADLVSSLKTWTLVHAGAAVGLWLILASLLVRVCMLPSQEDKDDNPNTFTCPGGSVVPLAGVCTNLHMMLNLKPGTRARLGAWLLVGLGVYVTYSLRHSKLQTSAPLQSESSGLLGASNQAPAKDPKQGKPPV